MFFWLDEHLYKILKVCLETISINIDGDNVNKSTKATRYIVTKYIFLTK